MRRPIFWAIVASFFLLAATNPFTSFIKNAPVETCVAVTDLFSVVVGSVTKSASQSSILGGPKLVNVQDPCFGATGNGATDDTVAIQAAIDYAYNHNIQGVLCPSGNYKISVNGSADLYLDPPGNLRSNFAAPTIFAFSLAFIGQDRGVGNGQGFGCRLLPTNDDRPIFMVGPGQQMKVAGISVVGPHGATYRANLNPAGVGIGIAGGNGGASITDIDETYVANFYTLYKTDANGACCLSDSNTWRNVSGNNAAIGIYPSSVNSDVNIAFAPRISGATTMIYSPVSRQITIVGGNLSSSTGVSGAFGISAISAFTKVTNPSGGNDYTFTGVIASPDVYWGNVYNSFTVLTSHFGLVPLVLTNWNSGTSTATFGVDPYWVFGNYGRTPDLTSTTDLQAEVAAVTTVYAAERTTAFSGMGISAENIWQENTQACQTLYQATASFAGADRSTLKNIHFNSDIGATPYLPPNTANPTLLAIGYCQQAFPFIWQDTAISSFSVGGQGGGQNSHLIIEGGDYGQINTSAPALISAGSYKTGFLEVRHAGQVAPVNMRVMDAYLFFDPGSNGFMHQMETQGLGAGEWDRGDYFLPQGMVNKEVSGTLRLGGLAVPYYGYHPAPGQSPNLPPDILTTLMSATPGALGTYLPISAHTLYKSVGPTSGALTHVFARSASGLGYSWGQNLDDSTVGTSNSTFTATISNGSGGAGTQLNITSIASGAPTLNAEITGTGIPVGTYITACPGGTCGGTGIYTSSASLNVASETMKSFPTTVTWSYKGQSIVLTLDTTTIKWAFPGLVFNLPGSGSTDNYVVTGVYANLTSPYITVMDVRVPQQGLPLQGTKTSVISCAVQCSLAQAAYAWTQYP